MVSLITELARPSHRTLIVVEECIEWLNTSQILNEAVVRLDLTHRRTLFVNTKLNSMLQGLEHSSQLKSYFNGMKRIKEKDQSFWLTLLSQKCRTNCKDDVELYNQRLWQSVQRDLKELEGFFFFF